MRMMILHDHLNPSQEVPVDADLIASVTPFGSGSAIQISGGGVAGVHETPHEVEEARNNAVAIGN
jgi:hypothetical protein